jgi:gas vesicle protein
MFRRIFWLLMGAGFGFGVSFWMTRFVRETIERYTPERVSADLAGALKSFGTDLRAAVQEGREAMQEREEELRLELESRNRRH